MSDVIRTVYGIYYPETRRVVDALWAERPHAYYERNYTGRQDKMHEACMERWRAWVTEAGVSLGDGFAHAYPTAGANEAIHALLAEHAARVHSTAGGGRVHVFWGEYEGYTHVAAALGLEVVAHGRADGAYRESLAATARPGDQFWLSQPSAIDGNLWRGFDGFCQWLAQHAPGVRLMVDLTYVGAVAVAPRIDLDHPQVAAVVWSLSKPFGVYYHRIGGVVSREEIPSLRGHHWFKNLFSVLLGERLMAAHAARELPGKYQAVQREVLARAVAAGEVAANAEPSDVVMLASAPAADDHAAFKDYDRGAGLRFCLSPGMDRAINP
jgi:histidinol-phosphate/aromatic aminotransferase/cobyric acid decarboxylase-like protein